MTDYQPGRLYAVTSWRGESQPAFRTRRGDVESWRVLDGEDTRGLSDSEVTEARPLVVLDLHPYEEHHTQALRFAAEVKPFDFDAAHLIADQIEAQILHREGVES